MAEDPALSATETVELITSKKLSPVEAVQEAVERINRRNPSLNAIIFTDFDGALERAKKLEQRIMGGQPVGRLAGVPTLMKDLFDFRPGWPATLGGIPALRNSISEVATPYPERVERDDSIILGKTNSVILGFRGTTDNPLFGPTKNPFDLTRNSGGSSGGSAAAVADGIVAVAGASDGGGSIRIPAAWSGVVGFQPSFGRVPLVIRPNAFSGTAPFVYQGPVSRCVSDIALVMNSLAGYDPMDPYSDESDIDFIKALDTPLKGKRIGFTPDFGVFPVDNRIADCVAQAVMAFELAGATVEAIDLKLPYPQHELSDLWCRLVSALSVAVLNDLKTNGIDLLKDHRKDLPDGLVYWAEVAANRSLVDMQDDQRMRTNVYDALQSAFRTVDFIVSPTTSVLPVRNEKNGLTMGPSEVNNQKIDPQIGWALTYMTNLCGNPAASVPAGLVDGLPVGLQIIGRRRADFDVISACAEFERARPWAYIYDIPAKRPLAS